jgi:cytochrome b subunit of formate dehydrogenase
MSSGHVTMTFASRTRCSNRRFPFFAILTCAILCFRAPLTAQTAEDCLACHSDKSLTTEKKGKNVSLFVDQDVFHKSPHAKLVCIACHAGFDSGNIPHKEKIEPINCLTCHRDAPTKHQFHPQLAQRKPDDPALSEMCKDCHGTHNIVSPKVPGSKFNPSVVSQACGECHMDEADRYKNSVHGKAVANGVQGAPNCITCHTSPIAGLGNGADSVRVKTAQVRLCLSCHMDNPDVRARTAPSAGFIAAYEHSVHGSALAHGNAKAANCVNCHSAHDVAPGSVVESRVNRKNIPTTCGQCHGGITAEYLESIHGTKFLKGVKEAPVCTNCHGEHNILPPSNPNSPVAAANVSLQVCTPCHSSMTLTQKFGIPGNRSETFSMSYHGLAIRSGSVEVANCASCHGIHNIKPSSDSTSMINKANLAKTCGKCHPGAGVGFTQGSIHATQSAKEDPVLYWVSLFYIIMIGSTIGGMGLHNLLDFYRKSQRKLAIRRGELTEEHHGHTLYVRMTLEERIQHAFLLVSFFTLVFTGFMLRYPEAWWVVAIRGVSSHVFDWRGVIHRVAAVIMVAASTCHLYYILFVPRGKQLIRDLLPTLNDITDPILVLKYNLGISREKPQFGRFSYIEKAEYWALIWGTFVMAATGTILWFDNTFLGILTKLGWDVARTVHYYEAWLAFLAIVVWHLYFVIFNPDTYPINLAFLKGTITEGEMAEEHPLELAALKRQQMEREDGSIVVTEKPEPPGPAPKQ